MKQTMAQTGGEVALGSEAANSSSRPQVMGRGVDPSTSMHRGKPTFNPGLSENTVRMGWPCSIGQCLHYY